MITLIILSFIQNVTFSMTSRARNRDNIKYHIVCSILSNTTWFFTIGLLVTEGLVIEMLLPYLLGTVVGSCTGSLISEKVEKVFSIV